MLEAKSARREARGEAPLDVDAEMAALTPPAARRPTRRCARRSASSWSHATSAGVRQGEEPLDVEAEIERQLRDRLGG